MGTKKELVIRGTFEQRIDIEGTELEGMTEQELIEYGIEHSGTDEFLADGHFEPDIEIVEE